MGEEAVLKQVMPQLLSTQLLAADVYTEFLQHAQGTEFVIWQTMLRDELAHIRFVAMLLEEETIPDVPLPEPSLRAFRDLCRRAREQAGDSPFERTLWGLRLEHAEIDFGLEALASQAMATAPESPVCPGPQYEHYHRLVRWARRYEAAREIAVQIARLEEHLPPEEAGGEE